MEKSTISGHFGGILGFYEEEKGPEIKNIEKII
jgi:hypothetical protein